VPQNNGFVAKCFASRSPFWCNRFSFRNGGWLGEQQTPGFLFQPLEKFPMKKTLIALAAVAATGAAFAQSSVTLYGVADAAIGRNSAGTAGAVTQDTQFQSSGSVNNGTSRWGVRGVEDLGGGLKAGFNFEQGLSLNDGAAADGFARAAYLNLMGGFGEVRLGRTLNPSFFAAAAWELTGTANYSVVVRQFGAVLGGVRNNSQIAYTTPSFGGVTATLATVLKGNDANAAAGDQSKMDLNVIYRGGPLVVALGYNKLGSLPAGSATTLTKANVHVGANYNFGGFKLAGAIIDPAGDAKGFSFGGTVPVGPVSLTIDMARDTFFKDTDVLLEAKYPLSKRTFAYAAVLRDGKATGRVADAQNTTNYGLGIRHNF
jgi:predicted porin